MKKDFDFPNTYKAKLTPLSDSEDFNGRTLEQTFNKQTIDEYNPISNGVGVFRKEIIYIKKKNGQHEPKQMRQYGHSEKGVEDEVSMQGNYGDGETVFEKSQIAMHPLHDNDSIIICDQSTNQLRDNHKLSNTNQTNANNKNYKNNKNKTNLIAKNLDEMKVDENGNYTLNRFDENEILDMEKQHKMAETQQYIDETFKNMISSQKQQHQLQQQQQQHPSAVNIIEPPQCRICLELLDEDDDHHHHAEQQQQQQLQLQQEQQYYQNQSNQLSQQIKQKSQISDPKLRNGGNKKIIKGLLMSPCKCSGSSKYIHERCLKEWIKQTYEDYSLAQCEICKQSYVQKVLYEKKLTCSSKALCSQANNFVVSFIVWLLLTHFFVITSILLLLDIVTPDKEVPVIDKSIISNTAVYILFAIDIICDIICLLIFIKYYIPIFTVKKLIDWQIMNFTKHPKEKHPKLIERYCEGKMMIIKDANSASQRNLQLQLMMDNSFENRNPLNNSMHQNNQNQQQQQYQQQQQQQLQNPQSNILTQSQQSRQISGKGINNSQQTSQRLARNGSNMQTINFFANMGVSEKILNDFLFQQDLVMMETPAKNDSNMIIRKCDSIESQHDMRTNLESPSKKYVTSSSPIMMVMPQNNSIFANQHLQSKRLSNNLNIPLQDDRDQLKSNSANLGKVDDNSKQLTQNSWQRHTFYAKNQPYEIIVKPCNQIQDDDDDKIKQTIQTPKRPPLQKEDSQQNERRSGYNSLKKFFEEVNNQGVSSSQIIKKAISNQTLQKVDSIIEVQEEELDKNQQSQDFKKVFRECESVDSSIHSDYYQSIGNNTHKDDKEGNNYDKEGNNIQDDTNDNVNIDNQEKIKIDQVQSDQISTSIAQVYRIKQNDTNSNINIKKQVRLQDILYNKIQQAHPEIQQQVYLKQPSQNEKKERNENKQQNECQVLSSVNTQINSQVISDSQTNETTQIYNKSFLSSINLPYMIKGTSGISSAYSKQDSREEQFKTLKISDKDKQHELQKQTQQNKESKQYHRTNLSINEINDNNNNSSLKQDSIVDCLQFSQTISNQIPKEDQEKQEQLQFLQQQKQQQEKQEEQQIKQEKGMYVIDLEE